VKPTVFVAAVAFVVFATNAGLPAAEPRWTMIGDGPMIVIGDQPTDKLREIAIQIEMFRSVVGGLIPNANRPLPLPTVVFVFGTRKSFERYLPIKDGRPAVVDGLFVHHDDANHILLLLETYEESAAIVYHEYTHLLLANAVRTLPVWLNEGLAEYYGSYSVAGDRRSAVVGRPLPWRVGVLRERYMPIRELIAVDPSATLHDESMRRTIFYAEAWALTHYLLTEFPNGAAAINKYAGAVAAGAQPSDAFADAFGGQPEALDKQLQNYVRRPALTATRFLFTERLAVAAPGPSRELDPGEADGWLGDLQRRVGRQQEAEQRIEGGVRRVADVPICQVALGLLRLEQNRRQEGIDALNRAGTLARDDFMTQFVRGVALLRSNTIGDENTASAAKALARAVALNPESSEAYAWLAYAEMRSDDTLSEARASIEHAIELSPGRLDYRLRYADVRILQGEPNEVRALLSAIAAIKTDPRASEGARKRIDAILASARTRDRSAVTATNGAGPKSIETPGLPSQTSPGDSRVELQLRHVQDGEQRAYAMLTKVECTAREVRFFARTPDREIVSTAKRMQDVDLIQYLEAKEFRLACGSRTPPDPVFLTWRPDPAAAAPRVGTAVAVEFLPKDYVPR
jgi:tetratricopeptide (TPR) repeat protein